MTRREHFESDDSTDRRTFIKRSAVASAGVGFGVGVRGASGVRAQEESGVQYYDFVVPDRGIIGSDFVNTFLFVTEFRGQADENRFNGCFDTAEAQVEDQFGRGTNAYDGVLVDATEAFQLFGDDEAIERLRDVLGGEVDLPDTLRGNVGAIVATRIFAPASAGRLPTDEGYRSTGGENCVDEYVRLRVHELPNEVSG
ncbi:twin-arginine translocation signal domain-containing protein [Halorussus salinisoli]|uniref:twin-arginine translocation signal domain-containing protein n=1 Tax=Halorussus salinisoli TaxID=2558242 RepID=UPI0010C1E716|nr:twin-arginine translocation signal domain-containing protein [Halorussus salinisoli]